MHFTVAVVLDKPKLSLLRKTLEPYQIDSSSKKYLIFKSIKEECIRNYNKMTRKTYRDKYGYLYHDFNPMFIKKIKSKEKDKYNGVIMNDNGEYFIYDYTGYTLIEIPYNIIWKTPDDFLRERYFDNWDEEKQDYGVWINPNGKWDSYDIYSIKTNGISLYNNEKDAFIQIKDLKETNINPESCYAFILNGNWYEDTINTEKHLKMLKEILDNPKNQEKYISFVNCHR